MKINLLLGLALLCAACSKSDSIVTTTTTLPGVTGTWTITDATVFRNETSYPVSLATLVNITKTNGTYYPVEDLVLNADGTYSRGKETGTYKAAGSGLTLGSMVYDVVRGETTLQVGNTFNDMLKYAPDYNKGSTDSQKNGFQTGFTMLTALNIDLGFATLNKVQYQVNYRKK